MGPSLSLENIVGRKIYLDTNLLIYLLEEVSPFFQAWLPLYQAINAESMTACTGDLCLAELLVKPLRDKQHAHSQKIKALFAAGYFQLLSHDRDTLVAAAELRAYHGLKMVDAIHVATAVMHGCDSFATMDYGLADKREVLGIELLTIKPNELRH